MKSFLQFINESAAQQAARLGLVGDGHGGWYDKATGEFTAKTEKGRLKFYNKRQRVGQQDPPQSEQEKNLSRTSYSETQPQEVEAQQEEPPFKPNKKNKGTLTIAFGRFNPPHLGHLQLMNTAANSVEGKKDDYMIVPSRSNDPKKNPLDPNTKVDIMKAMFPQHADNIMNDGNVRTIFDVLNAANNAGYANVKIVGGADRVKEFTKLANNYNGKLYDFDKVDVISSGERDPDGEGVEGLSASRMRLAASENDFKAFSKGLPKDLDKDSKKQIFTAVRSSMGINEEWGIWEMAPKFDLQTLRENYVDNIIYKLGELVENVNTGMVGRIIRRGTSYVICVTENKMMFKSWIKDINEVNNYNKLTAISGVPAENRLVGTDKHRKYAETMVRGSSYGLDFINKYRKRS
ncbi:MAG: hypothetical protein CM15mV14_0170 [uncultured marine virus]|nr:MAG: hypothetical protein CM15mV14_0170 [uncultured marine virus]